MNEGTTKGTSSSSPTPGSGEGILTAAGAVLAGFVLLILGGSVSGALMFANLKLTVACSGCSVSAAR